MLKPNSSGSLMVKMLVSFVLMSITLIAVSADSPDGMANPAAKYCAQMGYEYEKVGTRNGDYGVCIFPDKSECLVWDFLQGKCGKEFSYCAKKGYGLIVKRDGQNALTQEYAVCVKGNKEIGAVSELMKLSGEATSKCGMGEDVDSANDDEIKIKKQGRSDARETAPDYYDWRDVNGDDWTTPVKDQGICGSCWAFSGVGTIEAAYKIASGNPDLDIDLSEQYLVSDCFSLVGLGNCCGGWKHKAMEFAGEYGIPDETCMGYTDGSGCSCNGGTCDSNCEYNTGGNCSDSICEDRCPDWDSRLYKIRNYTRITENFQQELIDHGPLAVSLGYGYEYGGSFDENGIYRCTNDVGTNHAVITVGYNETGQYWIVKNSWGTDFQDEGYFKVGYGECGIETAVVYADLELPSCGGTITEDTRLSLDLECEAEGLYLADDVTLQCNKDVVISGTPNARGLIVEDKDDVIISSCSVKDFDVGVDVYQSSRVTITDSSLENNNYGVIINKSDYTDVSSNNIIDSDTAILLYHAKNNTLYNNYMNNENGVWIDFNSRNNLIYSNVFDNVLNAYEVETSNSNLWNSLTEGNIWNDLEENSGYPQGYVIAGPGDGVDYMPEST